MLREIDRKPVVPTVERIGETSFRVCVEDGTFGYIGCPNMYVVRGKTTAIIDTGTGGKEEISAVLETVEKAGAKPSAIVITHGHFDHQGGAKEISEILGIPVISETGTLDLGETKLEILPTPGHTEDSVCVFDPKTGQLFTGDTILGTETVEVSDMKPYMDSLNQLLALNPQVILPGHGPVSHKAVEKIQTLIAHRLAREARILEGIKQGIATPQDLIEFVYGKGRTQGNLAYEFQIESHLEKLIEEGVLRQKRGQYFAV